jgi:enamine deaminase RidA (YjgF/YER057c/UK114 family)
MRSVSGKKARRAAREIERIAAGKGINGISDYIGIPICKRSPSSCQEVVLMQINPINPQKWLEAFNINQAIEVTGGQRTLYVSGQTSNDASGAPMHPGDLVAQFKLAWKNLIEVLGAANMKPENIVRLNFYTTDVDGFMAKAGEWCLFLHRRVASR